MQTIGEVKISAFTDHNGTTIGQLTRFAPTNARSYSHNMLEHHKPKIAPMKVA
jgi:hypothetical protein